MSTVAMFAPPSVSGLDAVTQDLLNGMLKQWAQKRSRNFLRQQYLDSRNVLKDLAIAVPPSLRHAEVASGWPEKAVYGLAHRCMWDGVVAPGGSDDPLELSSLLRENRFDIELPQAIASSMAQSVSFISTTPGRVDEGEPEVLVMAHSALWSTGLWDFRRRGLRAALLINDIDDLGRPTRLTVMTPFESLICVKGPSAGWYLEDSIPHDLRRVPVEPMPYRPTLDRPFGRSRINRRVMLLTDRSVATGLRMDITAEMFVAPKLLLLGADSDAFMDQDGNQIPLWTWYMTRMNAISRDEDGNVPTVEQISQASMEPFIAQMRELAAEFSGETNIPLSSLGIVQDNPPSAEAIYAAKEDLVIEASNANRVYSAGLARVYQNAVMIRDGISPDGMSNELRDISTKWRNPAMPSIVSQSDAMVKQISAIPWLAESEVALEELGYTDDKITRLVADKKRAEAAKRQVEMAASLGVAARAALTAPTTSDAPSES